MDRKCYRCVYAASNPGQGFRNLSLGWPPMMTCVNHADAPGELREVMPHSTCANFRARREPPVRVEPPEPPNDEVRYIALTRGKFAIVDAADYERLNRYRWNAFDSGGKIYARRSYPGGTILMHREIMQTPDGMVVDHINGNSLNNRQGNLRNCTPRQNEHNKPPHSGKSRFKGVYPRGDKWYAAIKSGGTTHYLGTFEDQIQAAKARDRKAYELQGEYAYLNLPEALQTKPVTHHRDAENTEIRDTNDEIRYETTKNAKDAKKMINSKSSIINSKGS